MDYPTSPKQQLRKTIRQRIDTFLTFVDHMSCSADTYVSLGGSNGCADQLTKWDGTQKVGLGSVPQKKEKGLGR